MIHISKINRLVRGKLCFPRKGNLNVVRLTSAKSHVGRSTDAKEYKRKQLLTAMVKRGDKGKERKVLVG